MHNTTTIRTFNSNIQAALAATCPISGELEFNSTNVAALTPCTQLNFLCPINSTNSVFTIYNTSTTGPAPSDCESYDWRIWIDNSVNGSFSIPGVVNISEAQFQGQPETPLNLTSFGMPDLTTTFVFDIKYADKLQSLSLPVLSYVGENLFLNLSGESPPAINLSFPSLKTVGYSISLFGNIDELVFLVFRF
jgi:hypothetical protein